MRRGLGVGRGAGQRRHVSGSMGRRTVAMLTAASMFVEAEPALTAELALVRDELRVCDGKCIGEFNDTFVLTNDVVGQVLVNAAVLARGDGALTMWGGR